MADHLILTTDGARFETDIPPYEDGSFLVVHWNGMAHRIPMTKVRDWVTLDAPVPTVTAGPLARGTMPAGGPEPFVPSEPVRSQPAEGTTAPAPVPGGAGAGAPHVGQPRGHEREIPDGHPALVAGADQLVEVLDQATGRMVRVPVSEGGLPSGDTEPGL
jgi:hypothetical protein